MGNIINAIMSLVNNPVSELKQTYARKNRVNSVGVEMSTSTNIIVSGSCSKSNDLLLINN